MLQLISHQPVMKHTVVAANTNVIVVSVRPAMISNVDSKKGVKTRDEVKLVFYAHISRWSDDRCELLSY